MLSYCLKRRKNTESKNPKVKRTKSERMMFLSKCAFCDSKEWKCIKGQKTIALLSSFLIKATLHKSFLSGPLLYSTS